VIEIELATFRLDPRVYAIDEDGNLASWDEGEQPVAFLLPDAGYTRVVRQRGSDEHPCWVVEGLDNFDATLMDPTDQHHSRIQAFDSPAAAIYAVLGDPTELEDEGDGHFRVHLDCFHGQHSDVVVQPRPGGVYVAFAEHVEEPARAYGASPDEAIAVWFGVIQPIDAAGE
jgi:hypothetical protein